MATPIGLRVKLIRGRTERRGSRRGQALLRLAVTGLAAIGLSQVLPLPSAFGQTYYGTLTATIQLFTPVKSITLSTGSISFSKCQTYHGGTPLATTGMSRSGNGDCAAGPVTVTLNGNAAGSVYIQGSAATPDIGGGVAWSLCGSGSEACSGSVDSDSNTLPGQDQYRVFNTPAAPYSGNSDGLPTLPTSAFGLPGVNDTILPQTTPAPDKLFDSSGNPVNPGTAKNQVFGMSGPGTQSTANATANFFTTSISWTVI